MAVPSRPAVKKSVTIDADLFDTLSPERRQNLSATVNASLEYLVALDAQRELVAEWEGESGPFTTDELAPYLDAAIRAQVAQLGLDHARNRPEVASSG